MWMVKCEQRVAGEQSKGEKFPIRIKENTFYDLDTYCSNHN